MYDINTPTISSLMPNMGVNGGVLAPQYNSGMNVYSYLDSLKPPVNPAGTGVLKIGVGDTVVPKIDGLPFSEKLGLGLQTVSSILSGINGHRSYQLGKRQLTAQTDQFNRQFAAQRGLINSQLADRQDWRNRNQPGKFMSTAEYMDKYGVK